MSDVFISYCRADEAIARRFAEQFEAAGLNVWWDRHLRSGEDWDRVIEEALRNSRVAVVLWSPEAVASRWVRAEATYAQRNAILVPALVSPCSLPIVFEMTQTADLSHWSGDPEDEAWKQFIADVVAKTGRNFEADVSASPPPLTADPIQSSGERRRVTVLANTLTIESADFDDPEDRIELIAAAHNVLRSAIRPFAAHVLEGHGESMTSVFGLTRAREDDAIRAVDAALAARDAIADLAENESVSLNLRSGLRTGTIIVQADGDTKPLGGAIDEAHSLLAAAKPGEIHICPVTTRLVDGYFPLFPIDSGGWRVDGPHSVQNRFELSKNRGLSGFVGRQEELKILRDACEHAARGNGKAIGLSAEAGSGKSRLSHEFKKECQAKGMQVIEATAKVNTGNSAMLVVLELFRSVFGLSGQESRAEARAIIADWVESNEPKLESALPLIFEFLALTPSDAEPIGLDPQLRQRQLIALFRHLVTLVGKDKPALVLVEDLHWLDEASGQFLEQLVEAQARSPSLLLLNYRPEFRAEWLQGSHCQQISLERLSGADVGELITGLMGDHPSIAPLHAPIIERTKSNPFFIEEIVRSLAETGELQGDKGAYQFAGNPEELGIPDTVSSVLASRIDRLSPRDKAVLQAASVIGKEFDEPLLAEICDLSPVDLGESLINLQRTEFVEETEIFPVSRFSFQHPLTQETTNAGLLRRRRKELHSRIAAALSTREEAQLDQNAAIIAQHWDAAGSKDQAAIWFARAAEWSMTADYSAAIANWQKVRQLVGPEPTNPDLIPLAIGANLQLLNLNFRVKVDLELGKTLLEEGKQLAELVGDRMLQLQQRMLYSRIQCGAGDLSGYLANARQNLAAAQEAKDDGLQLVGTIMLIDACNYSCLYDEVIEIADRGCKQYPRDLPREAWATGFNPYTFFAFTRGAALGWKGDHHAMLEQFEYVYKLAREDETPEVVCWLLFLRSIFATAAKDTDTARASIEELRELSDKAGVPLNVAHRHLADADFAIFEERFTDACESAEKAHRFFALLERQWEAFALMLHARALLGDKKLDAAMEMGARALASAEAAGVRQMASASLIVLAQAGLERDGHKSVDTAREQLGRARKLIEETGANLIASSLETAEQTLQGLITESLN